MIDPNVLRAVGEVLESHGVTPRPGERLADTVSRTLGLSDSDAERWVEALSEGCTVDEANRRAGIASHRGDDPLLISIARAIGKTVGKVVDNVP
jgi:hypothetical protein